MAQNGCYLLGVHVTVDIVANNDVGCQGTTADASDCLQAILKVRGSLSFFKTQLFLDQFQYCFPAPHMTGSSPTYPDYVLSPRLSIKMRIKTNYSLNIAREQSQIASNAWNHFRRNIPHYLLDFMEKWD